MTQQLIHKEIIKSKDLNHIFTKIFYLFFNKKINNCIFEKYFFLVKNKIALFLRCLPRKKIIKSRKKKMIKIYIL